MTETRNASSRVKRSVIPDNAACALIRNPDALCEIPGSRYARPGMTVIED